MLFIITLKSLNYIYFAIYMFILHRILSIYYVIYINKIKIIIM